MTYLKTFVALAVSIALIAVLDRRIGTLPPLGKIMQPYQGVWQNAERYGSRPSGTLHLAGLDSVVTVRYDTTGVPHIAACTPHDLYFVQGYVTALDRLWQMEVQSRLASGTLSEIFGRTTLDKDREQRQFGLGAAAEGSLAMIMGDRQTRLAVQAYTEGVNARIDGLGYSDLPVEFKLLDIRPSRWSPLKTAYLMKLYAQVLSGNSDAIEMSNAYKRFGDSVMQQLFPDTPYLNEPIIPKGTQWSFSPLPAPAPMPVFKGASGSGSLSKGHIPEGTGSNAWAVEGSHTTTGFPILASDPHLGLTLPSVWYQVQLEGPDINVYGVSIAGVPSVIIGFNRDVAWGMTNVGADVMDWYALDVRRGDVPSYRYGNRWEPMRARVEKIKVRGGGVWTDTVFYARQGPVSFTSGHTALAFRWTAQDSSNELKTFYALNRAHTYTDCRKALESYVAPAQNFVVIAPGDTIGLMSAGRYPLKYRDQGKYVLDGSSPGDDWKGWIPADQNPSVTNPVRGFVSSANQAITDGSYPYYLNWEFASAERARRINSRLSAPGKASGDTMAALQTDTYSIIGQTLLTDLLGGLSRDALSPDMRRYATRLDHWDLSFSAKSSEATLFSAWWAVLYNSIWQDVFAAARPEMKWPSRDVTIALVRQALRSGDTGRPEGASRRDMRSLVQESFIKAVDSLGRTMGPWGNWAWGRARPFQIPHLSRLHGFGSGDLFYGGAATTVNAVSRALGPSWRMVVEAGAGNKGRGILPGGISGNPGSSFYTNQLPDWIGGRLRPLIFTLAAVPDSAVQSTFILQK
jgi:penicillin amidase